MRVTLSPVAAAVTDGHATMHSCAQRPPVFRLPLITSMAMVRSLAVGGLTGLKTIVADFHAAGVKVLLSFNPWDSGTRAPSGSDSQPLRMMKVVANVGADGINGDTMEGMPAAWWDAAESLKHPVVFMPEQGFGARDWLSNLTCVRRSEHPRL